MASTSTITIVSYDTLFFICAKDAGLVDPAHPRSKTLIRETIRNLPGGEDKWQHLQAQVYGRYMKDAELMPGFNEFMTRCTNGGIQPLIISHKTQFSVRDQTLNLREAALNWMTQHHFFSRNGFGISRDRIFFASTREEKIRNIIACGCSHFIDDLPEVLTHEMFPRKTHAYLFTQDSLELARSTPTRIMVLRNWRQAIDLFFN